MQSLLQLLWGVKQWSFPMTSVSLFQWSKNLRGCSIPCTMLSKTSKISSESARSPSHWTEMNCCNRTDWLECCNHSISVSFVSVSTGLIRLWEHRTETSLYSTHLNTTKDTLTMNLDPGKLPATRVTGGPATPRKGPPKFKQRQTRQFKSKPPKKGIQGWVRQLTVTNATDIAHCKIERGGKAVFTV